MGSACWTGAIAAKPARANAPHGPMFRYSWAVLYWMPYDNDLGRFGESIVEMLARGTQTSNAAVAIQSDYPGDPTMRRRQIVGGTIRESDVAGEDSSDVSAFTDFLDWAYLSFTARHWAVVIVGHGGKINEISPDDHTATSRRRTWMKVNDLTHAVTNFNRRTEGRVELLFFQNCNKATLEVVYEARHCAQYTLASQLALGAPNDYYEGFLNCLDDICDGREAAIALVDSERADMYHTLTLVNNSAMTLVPEKLSQLLQPILDGRLPIALESRHLPTYWYFGERHCDLLALLSALSNDHQYQGDLAEFAEFLRSRAIAYHKTGGEFYAAYLSSPEPESLCGLGLYFPEDESAASRYSPLSLYQEVGLVAFYERILGVPTSLNSQR
jgi:hypothetical protein